MAHAEKLGITLFEKMLDMEPTIWRIQAFFSKPLDVGPTKTSRKQSAFALE